MAMAERLLKSRKRAWKLRHDTGVAVEIRAVLQVTVAGGLAKNESELEWRVIV
jgi:hypothetical protein